MIEHEIIFLGLLKEGPKHGYDIKKKVKEILSLFAGIELKSIYYPLRILENKGLVLKRVNKKGKRPQRLVYELTPKGESRFKDLLEKSLFDFKRPQFSLDLSLYFLEFLKPEITKRKLRGRKQILDNLSKKLRQLISSLKDKKSSSPVLILEHNLQMVETEVKFISELINRI